MLCKYEKQITITRIMLGTPLSNQSLRLEISANLYILKPGSDFCDFLFSNFSFIRFHKDLIYIYFWKVIIEEFPPSNYCFVFRINWVHVKICLCCRNFRNLKQLIFLLFQAQEETLRVPGIHLQQSARALKIRNLKQILKITWTWTVILLLR